MQLSETVKLYLTEQQLKLVIKTMDMYITAVNDLVQTAVRDVPIKGYTSKDVNVALPSAVKNQCIRDAKSIVKKYYKACHKAVIKNRKLAKEESSSKVPAPKLPVLKKPCCYINNQNFKIVDDNIQFPVMLNGKSTRISVATKMTNRQKDIFANSKLGTLRIVKKNHTVVAQIVYDIAEPELVKSGNVMGVDLGIKCPAVSRCTDGSVKFYGNGRKNKYIRRHYAKRRNKLQKAKKMEAVKRFNNKEQCIMKDIDHKVSRAIVNEAAKHGVSTIKLEQLQNIRSATRTSRKNNHNLHNWTFYRLAGFIEYKAKAVGIEVIYVNPSYTSQICPVCGKRNHAKDRNYICKCGFHAHRDLVGAINICNSTEYVGDDSNAIRHTA